MPPVGCRGVGDGGGMVVSVTFTFPCGAILTSVAPTDNAKPGRRVRIVTFDSDGDTRHPEFLDGRAASCVVNCPKQKHGRKLIKAWPSDESKSPPPWRYVPHVPRPRP